MKIILSTLSAFALLLSCAKASNSKTIEEKIQSFHGQYRLVQGSSTGAPITKPKCYENISISSDGPHQLTVYNEDDAIFWFKLEEIGKGHQVKTNYPCDFFCTKKRFITKLNYRGNKITYKKGARLFRRTEAVLKRKRDRLYLERYTYAGSVNCEYLRL